MRELIIIIALVAILLPGCAAKSLDGAANSSSPGIGNDSRAVGGNQVVDSAVAMQAVRQYGWLVGLAMLMPTFGYTLTHRWNWTRGMLDVVKGKKRISTKEIDPP